MKNLIFLLAGLVTSVYSYSQTTTHKAGKLKVLEGNAMHYTRVAATKGSGIDSIAIPVFHRGSVFEIGTNKIICDSAIVDIYNDSMTAYNVIITSSSNQSITGSQFVYNDITQNGILRGQITSYKKDKKTLGKYAELDFSVGDYKVVRMKQ